MSESGDDCLGRAVRETWVGFAREQGDTRPSHLLPWDELDEANREVDRRIGRRLFDMGCRSAYTGLELHEEAGHLWAHVSALPGCFASGTTVAELFDALAEAVRMYASPGEDDGHDA